VPKAERDAALARVAKMLQIEHLLDRKPAQLSGGQRQRVAMGRALARDPKLFLFDEPLSNLDAKLRVEMRAEIKLLHQRTRTTTVYVTHDQVEAMTLGDRIAVMRGGRIEQFGSPSDIYGRPATRFVADFIGSPAMNVLEAVCRDDGVTAGATPLAVTPAQSEALRAAGAARVLYGVRPEAVTLGDHGLPGRIRMVEPTGPDTYAMVETPVGPLTVRVPGTLAQRPGDPVHLAWPAAQSHLFDAASERRIG
jgi:multiple sugar transport system ATP-binding protein